MKLYSQNNEDGAILQALRCMGGHGTKEYFEFGSETGIQVNTRILREHYGWHGHLLDGGHEDETIPLHKEFFSPTNIVSLLKKYSVAKTLDVLSIDADWDDFYIMREILLSGYRPRILVSEYNRNFGWDESISVLAKLPVDTEMEHLGWEKDCYFGASALALTKLARAFGYTLVFSNSVNLIFVQTQQAQQLDLLLPDMESIVPPKEQLLHTPCSGKSWAVVDDDSIARATDASVSYVEFAQSLSTIKLNHQDVGDYRFFETVHPEE
jgi:hypothetical protein